MRFIQNDGGRLEAGRFTLEGDCVVRAICNITGYAYEPVYRACALSNAVSAEKGVVPLSGKPSDHWQTCRYGVFTEGPYFQRLLANMGFVDAFGFNGTYWQANPWPTQGRFLLKLYGHATAICNGNVVDSADPRQPGAFGPDIDLSYCYQAWEWRKGL